MTSASISHKGAFALPLIFAILIVSAAVANETIELGDGTTCSVIESGSSTGTGSSTSITASGGGVSSSMTIDGRTWYAVIFDSERHSS